MHFILAILILISSAHIVKAQPAHHENQTIMVNGVERSYIIHLPKPMPVNLSQGLPVVIALHGGGGSGEQMAKSSRLSAKADKNGFIAVYPNGTGRREDKFLTWNASKCCAFAMRENSDDVAFISALIDKLIKFQNADPTRIYITGMSNGGLMAHRLGAELAPKIAAIGVVAGTIFSDQPLPSSPVSVMLIHGLSDTSVPFDGGESKRPMIRAAMKGDSYLPVKSAYNFWREKNGCAADEEIYERGNITTYASKVCKNRTVVVLQTIKNGGHNWPGSPKAFYSEFDDGSNYLGHDATDELWNFFLQQRKYP